MIQSQIHPWWYFLFSLSAFSEYVLIHARKSYWQTFLDATITFHIHSYLVCTDSSRGRRIANIPSSPTEASWHGIKSCPSEPVGQNFALFTRPSCACCKEQSQGWHQVLQWNKETYNWWDKHMHNYKQKLRAPAPWLNVTYSSGKYASCWTAYGELNSCQNFQYWWMGMSSLTNKYSVPYNVINDEVGCLTLYHSRALKKKSLSHLLWYRRTE